jgi:hypothetical protein
MLKIKDNEMSGACNTHGKEEECKHNLGRKTRRRIS